MKILKYVGVVLLLVAGVALVIVALQPTHGHVSRSIVMNVPPSAVYAEVNGFKSFRTWSPWAKMDPDASYTFEGPESGIGAKMNWNGKKTGKGSEWITESDENKRVRYGLAFEGFDGSPYAEFILEPEGSGTKVTWTYDGDNNGLGAKAMWMFISGALDDQYTEGLEDLKNMIENSKSVQQ